MFICNLKLNKKKISKFILILACIICFIILAIAISGFIEKIRSTTPPTTVSDTIPSPGVANLTEENYTNILKEVHENLKTYLGQKISFTGYVYRVADLKENQFILARDMIINSKNQTVVVGFLCQLDNAKNFKDGSWINITGTIEKGYYYGDIPYINISNIEEVSKPQQEFVLPPDDSYIPTAVIY